MLPDRVSNPGPIGQSSLQEMNAELQIRGDIGDNSKIIRSLTNPVSGYHGQVKSFAGQVEYYLAQKNVKDSHIQEKQRISASGSRSNVPDK